MNWQEEQREVYKTEKRLFDEIKRGGTLSEILKLKKWEKTLNNPNFWELGLKTRIRNEARIKYQETIEIKVRKP